MCMRSGMLVSLNQRAVRLRLCRLTAALLWLAGAVSETSAAPSLRPCALLQRKMAYGLQGEGTEHALPSR